MQSETNSSTPTSYYIIRSRLNNLRLDVSSRQFSGGSAAVTAWLAKNWSDQLWYDDPKTGTIGWKKTNHCLELEDNVVVVNQYCHGNTDQLWRRDGSLIRQIANPNQVICIEESHSMIPGAKVAVNQESGSLNEQFDFVHVPGLDEPYERRNFYIVSEFNGRVLDVRGERSSAGTDVIVWPKKSSTSQSKNQLWYFDSRGVIRSALNDLVIESQYGASAKVEVHMRHQCQEWTLVEQGIISKTGECLEINESEIYDGSTVCSSKFYDTPNQRWRLEFQ